MSYSLFLDLTQLPKPGVTFPATELIQRLLEYSGREVTTFHRNVQVSFRVVDRARNLWAKINTRLKDVEENDNLDEALASYDASIGVIDPLEKLLLQLADLAEIEALLYLPEISSIAVCIDSVQHWKDNRKKLRDHLSSLRTTKPYQDFLTLPKDDEVDIISAFRYDDATYLAELCTLTANRWKDPNTVHYKLAKMIDQCNRHLERSRNKMCVTPSVDDKLVVLTTSYAMLAYGMVEMTLQPQLFSHWSNHKKATPVWEAAKAFLDALNGLPDFSTPVTSHVEQLYEVFVNLLKGFCASDCTLPTSYIQLFRIVPKIRRPYHAQALVLVALCRELARHFTAKENRTDANFVPLDEALEQTQKALEACSDAVSQLSPFNENSETNKKALAAVEIAQEKVKECFMKYGLGANWSTDQAMRISRAKTDDQTRMAEFNSYVVKKDKVNLGDLSDLVTVTATVGNGANTRPVTLKVKPNTRLPFIQCFACGSLTGEAKTLGLSPEVKFEVNGQFVGRNEEVCSVQSENDKRRKICAIKILLPAQVQSAGDMGRASSPTPSGHSDTSASVISTPSTTNLDSLPTSPSAT